MKERGTFVSKYTLVGCMGTLVLMVHSISNMQAGNFLVEFQPEKL